jgi:phosphoenolpyruvate synthase/pyruvate phosphate dikinase
MDKLQIRDSQIAKDPNLGVMLQSHEMEKLVAYMIRVNREENSEAESFQQTDDLLKRLDSAITDLHRVMNATYRDKRNGKPPGTTNLEILKKYRHNLLSVIRENNMILTTKNIEVTGELVGNKGFHLWRMKNELGLNVPECLFLTTEYSKKALSSGTLPEQGNLAQLFLYFEGKEVAVRSSGVVSMPGMMDTFFLGKDHTSDDLFDAIRKVIESWNAPKAVKYRKLCQISDEPQIAVVIQEKVDCEHTEGFAGIIFTRNVVTGDNALMGEFLNGELGDEIASGRKAGRPISELPSHILQQLQEIGKHLETHYRRPQDIEWAYDGTQLYVLQTRNAKLSPNATAKIYLDMWDEGLITDRKELKSLVNYRTVDGTELYRKSSREQAQPLTTGTTASKGFKHGVVVFLHSTTRYGGYAGGNVLVANMTTTDHLDTIKSCDAIVTLNGGATSHPAIIARELNKPCVVSIKEAKFIDSDTVVIGGVEFREGDRITVFADTGEIYAGHVKEEHYYEFDERLRFILDSE